ncbi:MAG: CPBP family intramembrane metalloprotease [Prosthecobacter sp.]|nr:CPBP family intramembrane metalloprotease [Prosthecobacter sp.]
MPAAPSPALARLLLYLLAVMLGGALLAAPFYHLGQAARDWLEATSAGDTGPGRWLLSEIRRAHFTRYFNRAVLVSAILFIWPCLRGLRMDRRYLPSWRLSWAAPRQFLIGFSLAAGLLLLMGFVFLKAGAYQLRPVPGWGRLAEPITAALGAGVVEEFFFRAWLLGLLLGSMTRRPAIVWAVFIFAIVHFLKPPDGWQIADSQVTWHSGFSVLAQIARGFGDMDFLLAEFATLAAVGWALTQARLKTGGLWAGIGLHAGWVFGLKWFSGLTLHIKGWLPWIGPNLKVGLVPLAMVLLTGWLALRLLPQAEDSE